MTSQGGSAYVLIPDIPRHERLPLSDRPVKGAVLPPSVDTVSTSTIRSAWKSSCRCFLLVPSAESMQRRLLYMRFGLALRFSGVCGPLCPLCSGFGHLFEKEITSVLSYCISGTRGEQEHATQLHAPYSPKECSIPCIIYLLTPILCSPPGSQL